jgi:hypothetical protein
MEARETGKTITQVRPSGLRKVSLIHSHGGSRENQSKPLLGRCYPAGVGFRFPFLEETALNQLCHFCDSVYFDRDPASS